MKDYKLYLFDFDGTLFDSYFSLIGVYQDGFASIGQTCTAEEAAIYMHESLFDTCKKRGLNHEDMIKVVEATNRAIDFPKHLKEIKIYQDSKPAIETLFAKGKDLAIVSGNSEKHIRLTLKEFGMEKYFSTIVGASIDRRPKPFPDPLLDAMKSYPRIAPSDIVYVGDSLQDPECAKNAGIDGILIERNKEYVTYQGRKITTLEELLK